VGQLAQAAHVVVLDVAAVLAQVHGDAVGAAEVGLDRGPDRIGLAALARLAHRRHVVDVYAKFNHVRSEEASKDIRNRVKVPAVR